MRVIEHFSQAKHSATPSEDLVALSDSLIAVIDGATPKSDFRFPGNESPGHMAARLIETGFSAGITDPQELSALLLTPLSRSLPLASRPIASMVYYDDRRRHIVQVGDAPFAWVMSDGQIIEYRNEKQIDHVLSDWRASILRSLLERGIYSLEQLISCDPARKVIQPFITRQVIYQNTCGHRYSFGVMDGQTIPGEHIHRYPIPADCREIILASDGFPRLLPSLQESLDYLRKALQDDLLCIGPLRSTKGLKPGATWPDDLSYVRLSVTE